MVLSRQPLLSKTAFFWRRFQLRSTACGLVLALAVLCSSGSIALESEPTAGNPGPTAASPASNTDRAMLAEADLAPVLLSEPFRQAKALFDAGRYAQAIALLPAADEQEPLAARFLRALLLLRTNDMSKAGQAFDDLATSYPALADRCHYLAGIAWQNAGELDRAIKSLSAVDAGSSLYLEAKRALATTLRDQLNFSGALKVLLSLTSPPTTNPPPAMSSREKAVVGDLLFEIAGLQENLGQRQIASTTFLKVWSEYPISAYAEQALARAKALQAKPTLELQIARGELLLDAQQNRQAVKMLTPIVEHPPKGLDNAWLCRAQYALGKGYRKRREHSRAIPVLEKAVDSCEAGSDIWSKALYMGGMSASVVQPDQGISLFNTLAQEAPDHSLADDALFHQAALLEQAGRVRQARIALVRLIKFHPQGDLRAAAMFKLFWLERNAGNLQRGLGILSRLKREYASSDSLSAQRASYWIARTLASLNRTDDALIEYENLATEHPASFYAMLARSRLYEMAPARLKNLPAKLSFAAAASPSSWQFAWGTLQNDRHVRAALELIRIGYPELATEELLFIDRKQLLTINDSAGLRLLVFLLNRAGETRMAQAVARVDLRNDFMGPIKQDALPVWQLAYPLAFRNYVEQRSKEAGIDPDLLQALIREESALDPKIHSWAGAVGLCQLMPSTAKRVARSLREKGPVTIDRLHNPDFNLRLGANYLAGLLKLFHGNVALSLAAYNAGENAVSSWLKNTRTRDLDEFIEEVPYTETRDYVKRVLRSWSTYQQIYGHAHQVTVLGQAIVASK